MGCPNAVGVFNGEGPPVPIPNTEVKLTSADDTCLETDRDNRSTPTQSRSFERLFFFIIRNLFQYLLYIRVRALIKEVQYGRQKYS